MEDELVIDFQPEDTYPQSQRMLIIKVVAGGDIHAEDNDGQMIICRTDGTVSTLLHGDKAWVHGDLANVSELNLAPIAWDIIGFHLGLTEGMAMGRVRDGLIH